MNTSERFEFKFLITTRQRDQMLETLNGELRPDANGGAGGSYPIVSLYYDTADWRCYWDVWRGMPSRRKLRVRVYGTADGAIAPTSFVEIKHKVGALGVKRRVQTSLAQALEIAAGSGASHPSSAADRRVVEEVHRLVHEEGFRPACVMRYHRHAYSLEPSPNHSAPPQAPLRLTFDDQLAVRFDHLCPEPDDRRFALSLLPADQLILEIKGYGAVPYAMSRRLAQWRISPRSFSKYRAAINLRGTRAATPGQTGR